MKLMPQKKPQSNISVSYKLIKIHEESFSIKNEFFADKDLAAIHPYYEVGLNLNVSGTGKEIPINVLVGFEIFNDKTKSEIVVEYKNRFEFKALNEGHFPIVKDKVSLPEHFVYKLIEIALLTTRGILYARLKSTPLEKGLLDAVNPDSIIEQLKQTRPKKK